MARSRNIKPGFFGNDELAEIEPLGRLLFAGLWTIADREGRLEDRPKKIKAAVLAYDDCDVERLLNQLAERGFIIRYEVSGTALIQIATWERHQNPHKNEPPSVLAPCPNGASTVQAPEQHSSDREDQRPLIPDSSPQSKGHQNRRGPILGARARARSARADEKKPTPVPKPNRTTEFIDAVRAIDPDIPVAISDRDGVAIKACAVKPDRLAQAFVAAFRGDWDPGGNGWLRENLSARFVVERIGGYEAHIRAGPRSARQARKGQTAVPLSSLEEQERHYATSLNGGPGER